MSGLWDSFARTQDIFSKYKQTTGPFNADKKLKFGVALDLAKNTPANPTYYSKTIADAKKQWSFTTAGTGALTATAGGAQTRVASSSITLSTTGDGGITLGGAKGLKLTGQTQGYTASVATVGIGVSNVNLSTISGSQAALTVLDKAINTISDSRASMGAYQNRLTAAITNLETTSMNLQASRSRILDTDYAKETTNLAKSQIITQAATAMLAQANQSAQSVLALLK